MTNINMLSSQLSHLGDQQLIQEMRQPTGAVPQFLILSELQKRQKMRSAMPGQAPTSSVAQDVLSQVTRPPQAQGMPLQPMPQPSAQPGMGVMQSQGPTMGALRPEPAPIPQQSGLGGMPMHMATGGKVSFHDGPRLRRDSGFHQKGPIGYFADGGEVGYPAPGWYGVGTRGDRGGPSWSELADDVAYEPSPEEEGIPVPGWYGVGQRGKRMSWADLIPQAAAASPRQLVNGTAPISAPGWYGEGQRPNTGPSLHDTLSRTIGLSPQTRSLRDNGDPAVAAASAAAQAQAMQAFQAQARSPFGGNLGGQQLPYAPTSGQSAPLSSVQGQPTPGPTYSPADNYHIGQAAVAAAAPRGQGAARPTPTVGLAGGHTRATTGIASLRGGLQAGAPQQGDGTSPEEMASIYQKFSGMFPEVKHDHSKLEALMAQQNAQAPWLALSKAGFKMAEGNSPFFAQNAAGGLAGLSDDLNQQKVLELKEQLEMEGLSSKEAEAEATRRVNIFNAASKFQDRQDSIAQHREDSRQRSLDREAQMAQTGAYREVGLANAAASRDQMSQYHLSQVQAEQQRNAIMAHTAWSKAHGVGTMLAQINPRTKQPYTEEDSPYYQMTLGVAPLAASGQGRVIDFNSLK